MQGSGYYQIDKTRWRTLYWTVREIIQRTLAIFPWHSFAASNSEGTNYFFSRSFSVLFNFLSPANKYLYWKYFPPPWLLACASSVSTRVRRERWDASSFHRFFFWSCPNFRAITRSITIENACYAGYVICKFLDLVRSWHHNPDDSTDIRFRLILSVLPFSLISSCLIDDQLWQLFFAAQFQGHMICFHPKSLDLLVYIGILLLKTFCFYWAISNIKHYSWTVCEN